MTVLHAIHPDVDIEHRALEAAAVAGEVAAEVDRAGVFPAAAFAELRTQRLLSAPLPVELGGEGPSFDDVVRLTRLLGRSCGSTALVYAMHVGQVYCLGRHASGPDGTVSPELDRLRERLVSEQLLIASSTTEKGTGGDVTRSSCHVARNGDDVVLDKDAPVISYAEEADVVMVTARRDGGATAGDQVLVAVPAEDLRLTRTRVWDTAGFRGTCSHGYLLSARTPAGHVLPTPYSEISARTMLPASHVLWAAAWLGIADAARDVARRSVAAAARRSRGSSASPASFRLAELSAVWEQLVSAVDRGV